MHAPAKNHPFASVAPSRVVTAAAGIISTALGLSVLIGWYAHLPAILQVRPNLVPMQYNAALCILFSGAGLCAFNWRQLRLVQLFGAMVALLAGLTLCQDLCGFDLGIDQFLFHSYITTQTFHPGRMSPAASLCLLQIGLALFLMGLRAGSKWRTAAMGSLGAVVIAICVGAILGYAIDLPGTYAWGRSTRIALHTACGLAFLGVGIFVIAWNGGRKKEELTPRWLPLPLGLAVLAISLVFSLALEKKQTQETVQAINASAESVGSIINVIMEARIHSLQRMAKRWGFSDHPTQAAWGNYASDFPDFQAVEWIDPSHVVRWIVPLAGSDAPAGRDIALEEKQWTAMRTARQLHAPVITRMIELRGGSSFIVCVPVYTGATFDGCIIGAFQARALLDRYLPASIATGYTIAISEDGRTFYERHPAPEPGNRDWVFNSTMELPGTVWEVRVWPGPALVKQMGSSVPQTLLFAGLLRSIVLALIIYLAQKWSAQARKTTLLNGELGTALAEVRKLSGMLPICSGCKRIRDDGGYWNEIERYVSQHSEASFSHGICPECAKTFYEAEGMPVPEEIIKAIARHQYD